jgi:hypothetical protein
MAIVFIGRGNHRAEKLRICVVTFGLAVAGVVAEENVRGVFTGVSVGLCGGVVGIGIMWRFGRGMKGAENGAGQGAWNGREFREKLKD